MPTKTTLCIFKLVTVTKIKNRQKMPDSMENSKLRKQVVKGIAKLATHPAAGCCHLANLMA